MSGTPNAEAEGVVSKVQVKKEIKTIVENLETILGDLKDVAKELKEVNEQESPSLQAHFGVLIHALSMQPCLRRHERLTSTLLGPGKSNDSTHSLSHSHTHKYTDMHLPSLLMYVIITSNVRDIWHRGMWGVKWQDSLFTLTHAGFNESEKIVITINISWTSWFIQEGTFASHFIILMLTVVCCELMEQLSFHFTFHLPQSRVVALSFYLHLPPSFTTSAFITAIHLHPIFISCCLLAFPPSLHWILKIKTLGAVRFKS